MPQRLEIRNKTSPIIFRQFNVQRHHQITNHQRSQRLCITDVSVVTRPKTFHRDRYCRLVAVRCVRVSEMPTARDFLIIGDRSTGSFVSADFTRNVFRSPQLFSQLATNIMFDAMSLV